MRVSGFLDLSGKVFLITLKFSSLDYSMMFCNSSVSKSLFFLLAFLKYRRIITVKTVTLYKKLTFFR